MNILVGPRMNILVGPMRRKSYLLLPTCIGDGDVYNRGLTIFNCCIGWILRKKIIN
jgi:hypothetical protein